VGRHSVERHEPAGLAAVPADLTHVARLQVRAAPVQPPQQRRRWGWLVERTAGRLPSVLLVAVVSVALLGIAALALTVRSSGRPILAADQRTAQPATPIQAERVGNAATPGEPAAAARADVSVTGAEEDPLPARPGRSAANRATGRSSAPYPSPTAGGAVQDADPETVLRQLADRRAEAFAADRPELLAEVYQSPALLAQDLSQLRSRVPAGCRLTDLRTDYRDVTVTDAGPRRVELQVTASQPPASLVCAGTIRSRTEPAGPTRLALRLVRVGTGFRIASQRPGG
jgi:hypothetical protein